LTNKYATYVPLRYQCYITLVNKNVPQKIYKKKREKIHM